MKRLIISLLVCIGATAHAQTLKEVLRSVEERNTTLSTARLRTEAASLQALTDVWLENPEVEFGYMWGEGATRRIDVVAKQTFAFPTVYVRKRQIGQLTGQISAAEYRSLRREVLLDAASLCVEIVYLNAMERELKRRTAHADRMASAWERKLETGDASIIERNKIQKVLLSARNQLADVVTQQHEALEQLAILNGGDSIAYDQDQYAPYSLPASFDDWFDTMARRNPALEALRIDIERARRGVQLASASSAPRFALGYKSEAVTRADQFQGVVASVSIPLWQNKNAVKASKTALRAAESSEVDGRLQFTRTMLVLYNKAEKLEQIVDRFRRTYASIESTALLDKALTAGEISLLDYLVELGENYDLVDENLRQERELNATLVQLYSFEL